MLVLFDPWDPIRRYHSGPEWTWERWWWRSTPHSPKLQHYCSLTIRLFCVISWTLFGRDLISAEVQSVYSKTPGGWATGHLLGGLLPICRGAVGVFCSPSRLGHWTLVGRALSPLLRCSGCILQSQPVGPLDTCWEGSYPFAEVQSVYSAVPAGWATWHLLGGLLPHCRGAVGVFPNL